MTRFEIRVWLARFAQALLGLPPVPPLVPVQVPARVAALRRRS